MGGGSDLLGPPQGPGLGFRGEVRLEAIGLHETSELPDFLGADEDRSPF